MPGTADVAKGAASCQHSKTAVPLRVAMAVTLRVGVVVVERICAVVREVERMKRIRIRIRVRVRKGAGDMAFLSCAVVRGLV